jgi:hypothetical protein
VVRAFHTIDSLDTYEAVLLAPVTLSRPHEDVGRESSTPTTTKSSRKEYGANRTSVVDSVY